VVEKGEGNGETADISGHISQPSEARTLEAVLGDCVSNVVDRVVWQLKLVSICVEELSIALLVGPVYRGHGGQRGRGRRGSGGIIWRAACGRRC